MHSNWGRVPEIFRGFSVSKKFIFISAKKNSIIAEGTDDPLEIINVHCEAKGNKTTFKLRKLNLSQLGHSGFVNTQY